MRRYIFLLLLIVGGVYVQTLGYSFVGDDKVVISNNSFVKSAEHLPLLFSRHYLSSNRRIFYYAGIASTQPLLGSGELSYRPVTTLTYFLEYPFFGLQPWGYHLTNVVFHLGAVLLLFFLCARLFRDIRLAFLVSLLFGVHPVNAEAVSVISFREDLLVVFFCLASFLFFLKQREAGGRRKGMLIGLGLFSYALAVFSKETAAVFPVLVLSADILGLGQTDGPRPFTKLWRESGVFYLGFFVMSGVYVGVYLLAFGNLSQMGKVYPGGSFYTNLLTMSTVILLYLRFLLWPVHLPVFLPNSLSIAVARDVREPRVVTSLVLLIMVLSLIPLFIRRNRMVAYSAIWFFISLIPVSNIIPLNNIAQFRYLYLPSIGFCILLAWALLARPSSLGDSAPVAFAQAPLSSFRKILIGGVLVCYGVGAGTHSFFWANEGSIVLRWKEQSLDCSLPYAQMGDLLYEQGQWDRAIQEYRQAIVRRPIVPKVYDFLGSCYYHQGKIAEARTCYQAAIRMDPAYAYPYLDLGLIAMDEGRFDEAQRFLKEAIKAFPEFTEAYLNLASVYAQTGKKEEARELLYYLEQKMAIRQDLRSAFELIKKRVESLPGISR